MDSRTSTILTIAGITAVGGVIAYAAYFDHKRRHDVEFRKKLRKEKKRVDKTLAQSKESPGSDSGADVTPQRLREALEKVKQEPSPQTPEEKEAYFMSHVGLGEQLAASGPDNYLAAAMSFYRALRVYPSPVELIVIYQKTVPEPIFKMVMDMTNLDVKNRVEGYYEAFPPESTNVAIETRENGRKVAVVTKDVAAGEVVYKENPVVAVLDSDLQGAGKHCAHCFRSIQESMSIPLPENSNPLKSTFCSKVCLVANQSQSHNLLFTTESPLPAEIQGNPSTEASIEARRNAQKKFVEYVQEEGRAGPLLVARFIARQVALETAKMVEGGKKAMEKTDFTDSETGDYLLADHIERLRYLELKPNSKELPLLVDILQTALPGLEHFVTDERHATLLGKMAYNAYGVSFGGGRDDKPKPTARPEDVEKTRTPYGTQRQIGSAFYTLSSYLAHSCEPSARPSFSTGTTELHLIANRDLRKGDELTVAWVDVSKHDDESVVDCRLRRRKELARGWRLACGCLRCEEERKELTPEEQKEQAGEEKDGSKVEESMSRFEAGGDADNVE